MADLTSITLLSFNKRHYVLYYETKYASPLVAHSATEQERSMTVVYLGLAAIAALLLVVGALQIRNLMLRRRIRNMEDAARARIRLYQGGLIEVNEQDRRWVMDTYATTVVTWGWPGGINWRIYVRSIEGFSESLFAVVLIGPHGVTVQWTLFEQEQTTLEQLQLRGLLEVEAIILAVFRRILLPEPAPDQGTQDADTAPDA